ncbi:unnamed protein product [Candidula unifasciata]|uniref:Major facilitator superfamily (MFS) profile domain-containing protein n=1 Tax=Candidula unifasciata TaxID=100452 RepID=A0A8S3YUJ7_9EUPU|nr:unnamed protein product [Candidula unifasciata]
MSEVTKLVAATAVASFNNSKIPHDKTASAETNTTNSSDDSDSKSVTIYATAAKDETYISQSSAHYLWLLTSFSALGGFLFGYDTGVIAGAMLFIKDEFLLSSLWQEIIISITLGFAFISALLGGFLNDKCGRKVVTLIASFMFTVGAIILGVAKNVAMLLSGRLILGIGIGLASMTVPMYIAESAPANVRGRLVTINNFYNRGSVCCKYMLGLAGVPSAIQFCGFFFLPESPRWLMKKGRETEAKAVLKKLRGHHHVDNELTEIRNAISAELGNKDENTFMRILQTPSVRRAVILGCGLQLFQQLSGINTVMYYSATIIKMSGIEDKSTAVWLAALTAGINFIFTIVGVLLVERIGRRKLIIGSLIGVTASLFVLGLSFQLMAASSPAVTYVDHDYLNTTCSVYRNCEECTENTQCGFCYTENNGSLDGACLTVDHRDNTHAAYGKCQDMSLSSDNRWSYDYCPSSYSWMALLGLVLYLIFFAPGMGPMPWTINSEIYPIWARSTGNSLSAATNWISNLIVSMTFLTLTETITKHGTYWMFGGFAVLGLIFIAVCLPETKGHKLEEMEHLFSQPLCHICPFNAKYTKYTSLESETLP